LQHPGRIVPRYFILEEAARLLPRLTEILLAMQARKRELDGFRQDLAEAAAQAAGDGHLQERDLARKRTAVEEAASTLSDMARQITDLGCELKGIDEGLIDFRALREGREVYLCWRLGEERIAFWHDIEAGFGGRQPL
jgi:hypothetical protein